MEGITKQAACLRFMKVEEITIHAACLCFVGRITKRAACLPFMAGRAAQKERGSEFATFSR